MTNTNIKNALTSVVVDVIAPDIVHTYSPNNHSFAMELIRVVKIKKDITKSSTTI